MQIPSLPAEKLFAWATKRLPHWQGLTPYEKAPYSGVQDFLCALEDGAQDDAGWLLAVQVITLLMDRRFPTGELRRSSLLSLCDQSFDRLLVSLKQRPSSRYIYMSPERPWSKAARLNNDGRPEAKLVAVIDARDFEPQASPGQPPSLAAEIVRLYQGGFRDFLIVSTRGHRFIANGLGPTQPNLGQLSARFDVYGSSGDYLASGIDGAEIHVHGTAQDQVAQIMKGGKLVIYGDVGQTFMYGAKGGEAYILGNAAGRPLINAVGKPRVVINGTCLDYLAESFMAGDPHAGGGFVIVNGIELSEDGQIVDLESPYPGGNLFSLASGGAIFIRDPYRQLSPDQLNGGEFLALESRDWQLMLPYLEENARLFDISVKDLLNIDGHAHDPAQVYRKIVPKSNGTLQAEEAWILANGK